MGIRAPAAELMRRWQSRLDQRALRGCEVSVDLLPLLRGADHGGARVAALELLREIRLAAPWLPLRVLVSPDLAGEIPDLPASDIRVLPAAGVEREQLLGRVRRAGLLLSPLGTPSGALAGPPVVALLSRLGHLRHRDRLTPFEAESRVRELGSWMHGCAVVLCARADDARLLARSPLATVPVRSVRLTPEQRWDGGAQAAGAPTDPPKPGVPPGYLFYPANYWPHKNHALLLAAYALQASRGALPPLVCVGGAEEPRRELQARARQMGLEGRVWCLPAVPDAVLARFYRACRAVVLPWLRGGLAWPVREASRFGRPVFCSRFTRLPSGFEARLFDPRRPEHLAEALARAAGEEPWRPCGSGRAGMAGQAAVSALAWARRRSARRPAA